jgi:hypothetical protein
MRAFIRAQRKPQQHRWRGTFLLGVGAQKAGTTWLYSYLRRSRQFVHGYRKEYHVFDSLDVPSETWMRDRILRLADTELQKARRGEEADAEQLHRASMYADPTYYYEFFAGMLSRGPHRRLTGDVTPDYALLPEERFRTIKDEFAARRVRTAVVFLMRDPVERIYSQIRMQQGRQPRRFPKSAEEMVAEIHDTPVYQRRSRYEETIRRVDAVFAADDVHYGFYEDLFTESSVRAVCDVLRIPFHDPDFDVRRNPSQAKSEDGLPPDVVEMVAKNLAPTYRAVQERFPERDLTALWPSARHVL